MGCVEMCGDGSFMEIMLDHRSTVSDRDLNSHMLIKHREFEIFSTYLYGLVIWGWMLFQPGTTQPVGTSSGIGGAAAGMMGLVPGIPISRPTLPVLNSGATAFANNSAPSLDTATSALASATIADLVRSNTKAEGPSTSGSSGMPSRLPQPGMVPAANKS